MRGLSCCGSRKAVAGHLMRRPTRTLRSQLIAAFVIATLVPLGATMWIASSLLDRSLGYATTQDLDALSRRLEDTGRLFYQREREALMRDVRTGQPVASTHQTSNASSWPDAVRAFWDSDESERVVLAGDGGGRLDLLRRTSLGVEVFSRDLGGIRMQELAQALGRSREVVDSVSSRDLRRGFTRTLLLLVAGVWLASLVPLLLIAHRVSSPMRQLTAGLTAFARGDWDHRLDSGRDDEVGRAVAAFNDMAEQLRRNRERLTYLTQMSSWQSLARKTAHELKNSLTPIRLTVEEMLARQPPSDRGFMQQAAQIVVSEIETLEQRVRAFSEFASEPPVVIDTFDVDALIAERVALLKPAHPTIRYTVDRTPASSCVRGSVDLVKGILTNLLENAADAAGASGEVLVVTTTRGSDVVIEIHDSGSGLSEEARRTLFEPTITFKKHGMGLGLSIARKNALVLGGDVATIPGRLSGAAFRVTLPAAFTGPEVPSS